MKSVHKLGLGSAVALVVGCIIGSGVFVKPGRVLGLAGGTNEALLAWILGGIMTLAGGLTVAEIAARIPKTGGLYSFVEEIYGEAAGFVAGWVQALIYAPALIATLAVYFGSLLCGAIGISTEYQNSFGIAGLLTLTFISVVGTRYSAIIQNVSTIVKMIPVFVIGIGGMIMGSEPIFGFEAVDTSSVSLGAAVLATLWAYDGWMQVSAIAGELESPSKNLPRAIIIGISLAMVSYLLVNLSLFHVLDKNMIISLNERAGSAAATALFGSIGGSILGIGILISILGTLNGNILTLTRVPYAMALNGLFPFRDQIAKIHPGFQTPLNSILVTSTIAIIMLVLFNPDYLGECAIFSMYLFYGPIFFGIFRIRKRFGVPTAGNYRIPFYPVVPLIAIGGCIFSCLGKVQDRPWDALMSVAIAACGIPVFYLLKARKAS